MSNTVIEVKKYTCKCCGKTIESFTYGSINPLCLDCFQDMEELELEMLRQYRKDKKFYEWWHPKEDKVAE